MAEQRDRLGRMLLDAKMITEEQLRMATDFQSSVGGKLGAIIVKLGFIEDVTLTNFIAKKQGIRVVNLDQIVIPENLVKRLPRKLIETHHIIPIAYRDGVLSVATSDPYDFEAIEEIQLAQDARVEIHLAPRSQILKAIHQLFNADDTKPVAIVKDEPKSGSSDALRTAVSKAMLHDALIPLLIEKGVFTEEELVRKARALELAAAKERA
jgi:type IV pilus assembly protein PilB